MPACTTMSLTLYNLGDLEITLDGSDCILDSFFIAFAMGVWIADGSHYAGSQ